MTDGGYVKIPRRMRHLSHWTVPYHPVQAYLDLVFSASWSDELQRRGRILVPVRRGQVLCSQAALARRWGWNRKRIVRFFSSLQAASLIRIEDTAARDSGYTLLSVVEYDGYPNVISDGGTAGGQRSGQRSGHQEGQRSGQRSEDAKNEESDICSSAEASGGTAVGTSGGTAHDPVGGTINNVLKNKPKKNQGAAAPPPAAKPRRSHRVPVDFILGNELTAWARETRPDLDLDLEIAAWRDCEFRSPHSDWAACFRNWIRRAAHRPSSDRRPTAALSRDLVGATDELAAQRESYRFLSAEPYETLAPIQREVLARLRRQFEPQESRRGL